MATSNQFALLTQRRFLPYFLTQFLGAFNDNVFKNALIILIAFSMAKNSDLLTNVSAGLFILPFFLFSATAGQLADKYEKSQLIRLIKLMEIIIMLLAALGLYLQHMPLLIGVLFLMGAQSSFFGPIKYSILPQHLKPEELIGGNALVESGTFLAILLGTMLGGFLISRAEVGHSLTAVVIVVLATIGYGASRFIPAATPVVPDLKINWNIATETWRSIQFTRTNRTVFLSVLGISWFWFFGATYLTQLANYTRLSLTGNEEVVTLLLTLFSLGVGVGSLLCERLSGDTVEIGLVPFGSIGLTLIGIDLYFTRPDVIVVEANQLIGFVSFISQWQNWYVVLDILLLGFFGGLYIVPLYALIQQRSPASHRSRIIASNNILNALFMVLSAILAIVLLSNGMTIPELFLITAILNACVAIYIYTLVPEFLMRFLVWILIHIVYRVEKRGLDNIPQTGAAIIVCNHVSFVDALILGGCSRRPIRFVMDYKIYRIPFLHFIFKTAKAIPIASARENPQVLQAAYETIAEELADGNLIGIFPEGKITKTGKLNPFRSGVAQILQRDPVPVVPVALQGLWGSFFSRKHGKAMTRFPTQFRRKIAMIVEKEIPADQVKMSALHQLVLNLRGNLL